MRGDPEAMRFVADALDEIQSLRVTRQYQRLGFVREGTLRQHIVRDGARRDCEIYGRMR